MNGIARIIGYYWDGVSFIHSDSLFMINNDMYRYIRDCLLLLCIKIRHYGPTLVLIRLLGGRFFASTLNDLRKLAAFNRNNNRKYSLYIVNYIYFTGLWE